MLSQSRRWWDTFLERLPMGKGVINQLFQCVAVNGIDVHGRLFARNAQLR
jgi:hypothetical protein